MVDEKKFLLAAFDKANLVKAVNDLGNGVAAYKRQSFWTKAGDNISGLLFAPSDAYSVQARVLDSGAETHEGRKALLAKLGVGGKTAETYRLVAYHNGPGNTVFFKGHMDGDNKLVLTESFVPSAPDLQTAASELLVQPSFKRLPKPIEVQAEKTTATNLEKDGSIKFTEFELSPAEKQKLETQATFVSLAHQAEHVQLAVSNTRLPNKQQTTGPGLTT